jgi:CubicO group peptidase (beta-lactamase class C family)
MPILHAAEKPPRKLVRTMNARVPRTLMAALVAWLFLCGFAAGQYVPPAGSWEHRKPVEVGLDEGALEAAIEFAQASESQHPRDLLETHYRTFAREPFGEAIGPLKTRGPQTGLVVKDGHIVAEWGDPARVDMTFSVSKSFLSTTVGLAWAEGLIRNVDDRVGSHLPPILLPPGDGEPGRESGTGFGARRPVHLFESEHNRGITWNHLLRQTSDWEGTLWGKPDWSDRPAENPDEWLTRERPEPGTLFEYNDTRVNLLALAATLVWREPIQGVLRDRVMRPIGASPTWQWHGYESSWILLDGTHVQIPSGGGHWGGGMFINAYDQARFGLLTSRRYRWGDEQLLPVEWWKMATTPTDVNPGYGFMNFYLNTGRRGVASAPESAWIHLGSGANMIYCDPEHDLVVVARWIDGGAIFEFVAKVLEALE